MAIYGINFGYPDIPSNAPKVRERRRKGIPCAKGTVAVLVGACQTEAEKHRMTVQATNGRRGLYWESKGGWHFVWAYCPE
jgi:hypothetical protein